MQIRNVVVENKILFFIAWLVMALGVIMLVLPDSVITDMKVWGFHLGIWWVQAVEFSDIVLILLAMFLLDKSTNGSWWSKKLGG